MVDHDDVRGRGHGCTLAPGLRSAPGVVRDDRTRKAATRGPFVTDYPEKAPDSVGSLGQRPAPRRHALPPVAPAHWSHWASLAISACTSGACRGWAKAFFFSQTRFL